MIVHYWNFFLLFLMAFGFYVMYISPVKKSLDTVSKDTQLNGHFAIVKLGEHFDPRSFQKSLDHLKRFMFFYSHSYYSQHLNLNKLKHHHYNCMKYLRRIPFRLHNDSKLHHAVSQAIDNINLILENYTFECHDRNNAFYFGQHS